MTPQEAYKKVFEIHRSSISKEYFRYQDFIKLSEHKEEIDELKKIIIQDAFYASEFAFQCGERWIEAEEIIRKDPKILSHYFSVFVRQGFNGRWKEAEADILKGNANSVFNYYHIALHQFSHAFPDNVWKEAEPVFASKMSIFHQYVLMTKKPNKTYEEKILNNSSLRFNPKYIYDYSSKVLKSRWKEAEHIILQYTDYAAKYCTKFKLPVPEEIQNQIIAAVGTYTFAFTTVNSGSSITIAEVNKELQPFNNSSENLADAAAANLAVTTSYFSTVTTTTATLADGVAGQVKVFAMYEESGTMTITVVSPAWGGAGTITFDTVAQACTLQYVNGVWFCIGNNGAVFA